MRRILLCGKSLLISGLQTSLQSTPGLDLQWVDDQPEHIREQVKTWKPEVLIFETGQLKNALSLFLLQDFPQLKLIAVDIQDNRLLVFSGTSSQEPTPEELLRIIEG
jgi:hypothetical protein